MKYLTLSTFIFCAWLPLSHAESAAITLNMGDRTTHVWVSENKEKYFLKMGSNDLNEHEAVINQKNFDYIIKRLTEVSRLNSLKASCNRDQAEIEVNQKDGKSILSTTCLNERSERSESLRSLLNTLSIVY